MSRRFIVLVAACTVLIFGKLCIAHRPVISQSLVPRDVAVNCSTPESETGHLQMITYVKRKPSFTQQEFWDYWETQHAPKVAPLAAAFNVRRYQQVQVGGQILPTLNGSGPASSELVEFDGIAMFLSPTNDTVAQMLAHPYYTEVVAVDEAVFIDKGAYNGGMVATFSGRHVDVIENDADVWIGNDTIREQYRELFASYNT